MVPEMSFFISLAVASLRMSTPLLFASLGETLSERSGIINIGLEGMMLMGAIAGFAGAYFAGDNAWVGVLIGMIVGGLFALIMTYLSINLGADQVATGIVLNIIALGLSDLIYKRVIDIAKVHVRTSGFENVYIPVLSEAPVLGPSLFQHSAPVYMALILCPLTWFVLFRTKIGLKIRAVGEDPLTAECAGINVSSLRYLCVILAGLLAGLGGSFLPLGVAKTFNFGMTAGRGFICLAIVILGKYNPLGVLGAALLFGGADALQLRLQVMGLGIPSHFILIIPYILTLLVLVGMTGRVRPPKALAKPYIKEKV